MTTPPRWADRLLSWFCPPHLLEELLGDLHEQFVEQITDVGARKARRLYVWEVLRFCQPYFLKRRVIDAAYNKSPQPERWSTDYRTTFFLHPAMIRNYFLVAWRNLIRNKAFSAVNILGLALGMACSFLIFLWIQDEVAVDNYHVNGPHLYNVMERQFYDGKIETGPSTPGLLSVELTKQFPEIVHAVSYTGWSTQLTFTVGEHVNKEVGDWAGADWFHMFSVPLLAGTPATALKSPISIAISRKLAVNYFGSPQTALGRSIRVDNEKDYQVTAVFADLPKSSSQHYDFLLNWQDCLARNPWMNIWGNNGPRAYIQVRSDRNGGDAAFRPADVARLEAKMTHFLRKYDKDLDPKRSDTHLFLQAYEDAYLYSNFKNGQQDGGRIEYVQLFGIVAAFLLLIACINFMNLATARSVKRAREVGVRKVVGAARTLLAGQFMGEALLLTFLALLIALGLVVALLPMFNSLTGKQISLAFTHGSFWAILVSMALITGIIAGSYPALFLSSLNPVRVLKGTLRFGSGARLFRQGLVVFQFLVSMLLIMGTIVIYKQVNYIQTKNLGYDRENLLYIPAEGELATKYSAFKQELLRMPGIQQVTYSQALPTNINNSTSGVTWPGKDPNNGLEFSHTGVGYDYVKTLKINLKGRDFSPAYGTDTTNYLLNEAAARHIGYQDPVGKPITLWGRTGKIIGLLQDFHFQSLHEQIQPLIVWLAPEPNRILIRTQPGQTGQAIASLETLCRQLNPKFPFSYHFVDEAYQTLYRSETVIGSMASYFAFMAIFISCLGLFGLAAYTAEQRTKEIGVRKVLGASVTGIVALLSRDFLKLVFIAIVIASPLAWYFMRRWLADYTYKIDIEWWMFGLAGLLAVGIALLTVSFQSIKAALTNPVQSLRSE